ncbi:MAG: hypothetical protein JF616_09120 [Fibrobacteres bacterium]|nr:hypothetical protein [Fibrobacterota bacterium]
MVKVLDSTSVTIWNRNKESDPWDSVMYYTSPRKGQVSSTSSTGTTTALGSGYISIQMEGTSTEFAKIEVLNLVGCMTKGDTAYRAYFVKNDAQACSGVTNLASLQSKAGDIFTLHGNLIQATAEILQVDAFDVKGVQVSSWRGAGRTSMDIGALRPGLYNMRVQTRGGTAQAVYAKL